MLRNERYIGQVIWNRCSWLRSAADSSKRRRVENPRSEWIVREGAAIIEPKLWARAQARRDTGYSSPRAYPRYLLSGLLACGICGRKMIISGGRGHRYVCGNRHSGVGCENDLGVSRTLAEDLILQPITDELLSPTAVKAAVKSMRGMQATPKPDHRLTELRRLVKDGVLSESEAAPAMERLRPAPSPEPDLFRAADAYREVVTTLRESLDAEDIAAARPLLRELIGAITAVPTERDGQRFLTAHFPAFEAKTALVGREARLVAGAGFGQYMPTVKVRIRA
jgi:hypothetical protein